MAEEAAIVGFAIFHLAVTPYATISYVIYAADIAFSPMLHASASVATAAAAVAMADAASLCRYDATAVI